MTDTFASIAERNYAENREQQRIDRAKGTRAKALGWAVDLSKMYPPTEIGPGTVALAALFEDFLVGGGS